MSDRDWSSDLRSSDLTGSAIALQGDARRLGRGLLNQYRDRCTLILTSPPYGPSTHGHVRKHPDRVEKLNDRYSHNPDNLAHLPEIGRATCRERERHTG